MLSSSEFTTEGQSSVQADHLSYEMGQVFNECQASVLSHRRNCIAMRKIHLQFKLGGKSTDHSLLDRQWEGNFFVCFFKFIAIILDLKRNEDVVDRLLRFANSYLAYSNAAEKESNGERESGVHSRFVENYIRCLLHGIESKDKHVRQRICVLLGGAINAVDELNGDLLNALVCRLSERLFDKDHVVRIAAVHALVRLQELEVDGEENNIASVLINLLQFDQSPDVRKTVLAVLSVTNETVDFIVERSRDDSPLVRRFFFKRKVEELDIKMLSIKQREVILSSGLLDRDTSVRDACIEMIFSHWLPATDSNIIQFLDCLDVISNTKIAMETLKGFFGRYPSMFSSFPESYFESLTVETSFIMRCYCEFYSSEKGIEAVQELLPEVIKFANYLKSVCEILLGISENDLAYGEHEFVLVQLFHIGKYLDYSDEVSRRFMISLLHDILSVQGIPLSFIPEITRFLFVLSRDEQERIGIFGEIIIELHEDIDALSLGTRSLLENPLLSSPSVSVRPSEEQPDREASLLQQLKYTELLSEFIKQSPHLDIERCPVLIAMFNELVIPGINSSIAPIQETSLACLGQYCFHCKPLAVEYSPLLVDFFKQGHSKVKSIALEVLFDLAMSYGMDPFGDLAPICKQALEAEPEDEESRTIAVQGCCKLYLCKLLHDSPVLQSLLLLYFHPSSSSNPKLRQCLAYFFPAFCFGSSENQRLVSQSFADVILSVVSFHGNVPVSELDTLPVPLQAADQLLYWIDHENLIERSGECPNLHPLIAIELLKRSFGDPPNSTLRLFVQILNRLKIDRSCDVYSIKKMDYLAAALLKSVTDRFVVKGLRKFIASYIEFDDRDVTLHPNELKQLIGLVNKAQQ